MRSRIFNAALLSLFIATTGSHAAEEPGWIFRVGIHPFQPKENNHTVVHLDDTAAASFGVTYLFGTHWGVEIFRAAPMTHEMRLANGTKVAEFRDLPMTISLQYHILDSTERVRAFAGIGTAFTAFSGEKTTETYADEDLKLRRSAGLAAVIGLDLDLGRDWFINADARWFDIDSRATLSGAPFGTIEIDPFAFGLALGRRF